MYCDSARSGSIARAALIGHAAVIPIRIVKRQKPTREPKAVVRTKARASMASERPPAPRLRRGLAGALGAKADVGESEGRSPSELRKEHELLNHHLDGLRGRPC